MPHLIVLTGLRRASALPLGERTVIGRSARADVQLPDLLLSGQHACVRREGPGWVVEDLESTNGTYRNGARVVGVAPLELGDVLHVGTTELLFSARATIEEDVSTGVHEALAPRKDESGSFEVRLVADTEEELLLAPFQPVGITGVLPVVGAVGRSLAEAGDLEALVARVAEHFARAVDGRGVAVLFARHAAGGPAGEGEQAWEPSLRARVGPGGALDLVGLEETAPFFLRDDLVARALEGRGAILGRAVEVPGDGKGVLTYCVALPGGAEGPVGAVYVHGVREDLTRKDLRPLFLLAQLAGAHCKNHLLLRALAERNAELEAARSRLARWNDELQVAVAARTAELERSEASFRELFEGSRDGNLTLDEAGRLAAVNRTAAAIFERPAAALLGRPLAALLGPEAERVLAAAREPEAGPPRLVLTPFARSSDGAAPAGAERGEADVMLEVLARPISGDGPLAGGVHAIVRDVTERHRAEERMRLLSRIVESVQEAVVSTTLDGVVTSWNPGAEALYGYRPAEVLGKHLPTLPDDRGAEFERLLEAVASGRSVRVRSERVARRDDEPIPVEATFAPVPDAEGRIVGLVEIARDLRDRLRVEEQLRWRERMASFGELAAGLAHELGNPLANLESGLEFLLARERDPAVARESLETLHAEIERLQRLVRQVLDLARWAPPARAPVPLGPLLDFVARAVGARAAEAGVEVVRVPDEPAATVAGDEDQLKQALLNLVGNALDATPAGGRIELEVVTEGAPGGAPEGAAGAGRAGFAVRDTGRGIEPAHLPRVFDLFFSRRPGGSGIGLTMVKRIVDLHHGEVRVASEPGAGTRFVVLLPLAEPPAAGPVEGRET